MKQVMKILRKTEMDKQYEYVLQLEIDYELASLYFAMQRQNVKEMEKSKKRLKEIQRELQKLHAFV